MHMSVPAGQSQTIRLRLTQTAQPAGEQEQAAVNGLASVPAASFLFGQAFDGHASGAPGGGRRLLRRHHASDAQSRRAQRHAAGVGRHALEQAILRLRCDTLARRTQQ